MGASQVSAAVGGCEASGILDFHRVSPLTPTELTLGFFFGAPIREYVLFACTLPFVALFLAFGVPSVHGFVQLMIFLVAIAWVFHGLALLNSLIMKGQRSARGAVGVVVFFVLIFFNAMRMGRFIPSVALFDEDGRLTFFGYSLPWLAVVLFYVACRACFSCTWRRGARWARSASTLSPSRRRSPRWRRSRSCCWEGSGRTTTDGILEIVVLYLLVDHGSPLDLDGHAQPGRVLQRALAGQETRRSHLPWWDDLSLNRVFLVIACAIVLVAATAAGSVVGDTPAGAFGASSSPGNFPLAIAIGVLVVAYFGLALQYFLLRFRPARHDLLCSLSVPGLAASPGGRHDPGDGVADGATAESRARSSSA